MQILDTPNYRIGFAGTYFTLWTVRTNTVWKTNPATGKHFAAGTQTAYTYHQNLSKDEAKAIAKAKAKGCTNLTPDENLRGKRGTFVKYDWNPPAPKPAGVFQFGKYSGATFAEVNDPDYVFWYHNSQIPADNKKAAREYLLENCDDYADYKGTIFHVEEIERIKQIDETRAKLLKDGFIEGVMERNITDFGFTFCGVEILVGLLPIKQMFYHDITYYLPIIDGKAKRVKGKKVRLTVSTEPNRYDPDGVDFVAEKLELV